jgi:D-sedoheptulose 7-phosphate isomerase
MVQDEEVIVADMLRQRLERAAEALTAYVQETHTFTQAVGLVKACFERGGKLILCGNGGSAAFCSHAVDDFFVDVFGDHPMPVIALVDNTPTVTAVANDFGYERIFSQQLKALGNAGDVLIAVSTSGNSPNVLRAVEVAKAREMTVIGMTNSVGGRLRELADVWLRSTSPDGQVTEEMQLPLMHALTKCVAKLMFPGEPETP